MSSILKFCNKCDSLLNFIPTDDGLSTKCSVCNDAPKIDEKHIKLKISTAKKDIKTDLNYLKYDSTYLKSRSFQCNNKDCKALSPEFILINQKGLGGKMESICANCNTKISFFKPKFRAKLKSTVKTKKATGPKQKLKVSPKDKSQVAAKIFKGKGTVTITFGEVAENHVGMEKIGKLAKEGFSISELEKAKSFFDELGSTTKLVDLNDLLDGEEDENVPAKVLIVKNALKYLDVDANNLFKEHMSLDLDKKAFMKGRVVNKRARYNLCFNDYGQEPDYEKKKGRIIDFKDVPLTNKIRQALPSFLGPKAKDLKAEGNYYYDTSKCGIGYHGDSERKRVIAIRLGESMELHYQWYQNSKIIGTHFFTVLNHGDLYIMSEYATGFNWKKRSIPTLRHSAGCHKYTTVPYKNR